MAVRVIGKPCSEHVDSTRGLRLSGQSAAAVVWALGNMKLEEGLLPVT